jgi:FKBP-type peptidyl-prolyl cis-trans isomerase 2
MNQENQPYVIGEHMSYVKIQYRVRVPDGPVLKGGTQPEIMDFVTGFMQVVPGLESRLMGHRAGERLNLTVPAAEAFGEHREDLVFEKSKADFHFPPGTQPYPGMELPLITGTDNAPDSVIVKAVKEDAIVIDLNPPMAGMTLEYDLEILEARPASNTDICGEWQQTNDPGACCPSAPEIVLGAGSPGDN